MKGALCMALVALLAGVGPARSDKLRVVTTTADLAAIARRVGGERVEVETIARGYQDPHYVQARPSYMRRVNRADLLVYTGLQLEIGWLPVLIEGARNPAVVPGASGLLDASRGIEVLEVPAGEVDRTMGDIHPEGNPHYLLDPRNGLVVAGVLAGRLGERAPADTATFNANLMQFQLDLGLEIISWEERAAALRGQQVVAYHKQWEYLAAWLGMEIMDYVEDKPGIPPSPRHLAGLVRRMREARVRIVLCANYVDPATARRVAAKTGARVVVLPVAAGGEEGVETYTGLFEVILELLEQALDED